MDDAGTLILTILAAGFGLGLIFFLNSKGNDEDEQNKAVKSKQPAKAVGSNPEKEIKRQEEKARAKKLAAKRRADALAAKAEADRKSKEKQQQKYEEWDKQKYEKLSLAIEKHKAILLNNMSNALVINEYGHVENDGRKDEWNRFLASVGFPQGSQAQISPSNSFKTIDTLFARKPQHYRKYTDPNYKKKNALTWEIEAHFCKEVLKLLKEYQSKSKDGAFEPDNHPSNGHEFEAWVAAQLENFGWQTKVTTGSGDQGVDIIASWAEKTVGIQCKRFKKPVGNKAVQEIAAGVQHYKLDQAIVVSTGGYTKSAKELASSTDVLLISHRDLPGLSALLSS